MEVLKGRGVADVEQMAPRPVTDERSIDELPAIFVLARLPAVERLAVGKRNPTFVLLNFLGAHSGQRNRQCDREHNEPAAFHRSSSSVEISLGDKCELQRLV
jgi:hypothetical protein